MELIDKAAVVSEIEKRKKFVEERLYINNSYNEEGNASWKRDKALYEAYNFLLHFLSTLEVKEVDLRRDFDLNKEIGEQIRLLGGVHKIDDDYKRWYNGPYEELFRFAKYFFELGLKARKEE